MEPAARIVQDRTGLNRVRRSGTAGTRPYPVPRLPYIRNAQSSIATSFSGCTQPALQHPGDIADRQCVTGDGQEALALGSGVGHGPYVQVGHIPHIDDTKIQSWSAGHAAIQKTLHEGDRSREVGSEDRTEHTEDYDFQTGVWIGATLEQGVWYNMSVPLTLPGARQLVLPHDVEFAYTRDVPCTPLLARKRWQPGGGQP